MLPRLHVRKVNRFTVNKIQGGAPELHMMSCIYHSIKIEVERLEKYRNVVRTAFTNQSEQKCCSWVKMQFCRAVNQKTVHKNIFTALIHTLFAIEHSEHRRLFSTALFYVVKQQHAGGFFLWCALNNRAGLAVQWYHLHYWISKKHDHNSLKLVSKKNLASPKYFSVHTFPADVFGVIGHFT